MKTALLPASASWLALVAATTFGPAELQQVRAHLSGAMDSIESSYRLVVQTYSPESLGSDGRPTGRARPLGSLQRAVTAAELERGFAVNVMHLGPSAQSAMLVAWVEAGEPTLEFEALAARPPQHGVIGVSSVTLGERAQVVLQRRG